MPFARRALLGLLAPALLFVSCVGRDTPTDVSGDVPRIGLGLQPALIPSAADGSALPVNRVRAVVTRTSDNAVLADVLFEVSATDAAWSLDVPVPVSDQATEVVVLLYLLNVDGTGVEAVQFSGRSAPLSLSSGMVAPNVDVDLVRGPPSNLSVTGVTIAQAPDTLEVGESAALGATVTTSATVVPEVYWTSLSPFVVEVVDSVATGVNQGLVEIVASSGAFADTVPVVVVQAAVASVLVSPDSADVLVDATRTYTVVLRDARGVALTGRPVLWETLDSAVAVVDQAGTVLGLTPGVTRVRATSGGVSDEAVVRVPALVIPGSGVTWTRGSGGLWSDPANWTPARVPLATDSVYLTQGVDYMVTLDADVTVAYLAIGGTSDVINLDVGDFALAITDPGVGLEILPLGRLEIGNGSLTVREAVNYGTAYTTGAATIDAGFESFGDLTVASGILSIVDPGGFSYLYSEGTITVGASAALTVASGADLEIGAGTITGTGLVLFQLGSRLLTYADLALDGPQLVLDGVDLESSGTRRVTIGPNSTLQLLSTQAPVSVFPKLEVQGGLYASGASVITADSLVVAAGGSIIVDGTGAGTFFETTEAENFGTVALTGSAEVRFGPGANNDTFVNRPGASLVFSPGGVRYFNGVLVNEGDVTVLSPTTLHRVTPGGSQVAANHVNSGLLEILTGSLAIELGSTSAAAPTFTNTGTVTIGDQTTLMVTNLASQAGAIINDVTGLLNGTGTMQFVPGGSFPDPTGVNNGTIAPGLSPGGLTWMGSVPMGPTGIIAIELEGTTRESEYDALDVSSDLVLNLNQGQPTGNLVVTAPGFTPADGDRFAVLTFRARFGNFANVTLPNISGIVLDTMWAEAGSVDTLFVVARRGPTNVGGVWSANAGDAVTFIDVGQDTVATVQCTIAQDPCSEPRNPAVNSSGTLVAVPMRFSDKVMLIDVGQGGFSTEITDVSFAEPYAAAFTGADDEIWIVNKVTGSSGSSTPGSVTIIDVASRSVVGIVDTLLFSSPEGIAIANGKAYVANRGNSTVTVVDVATRTALQNVAVVGDPRFAVATPDGQFVYVSVDNTTVYKISTATDQIVSTVTVGGSARNLAAHPDGTRIYAALLSSDRVDVIDVATGAVSTITFAGAFGVYGVAVLRDGSMGFVTDDSRNLIYAFDPATGTEIVGGIYPVATGSTPRGIVAH